ncbi:MAG TPA: CHASE2 and HATPase_c domain-containing protein [Kiritimatiellia bacterium]|nr:CHASE2 and HATPase_c domain-containing protein [Kiritimatiellia bacterium]
MTVRENDGSTLSGVGAAGNPKPQRRVVDARGRGAGWFRWWIWAGSVGLALGAGVTTPMKRLESQWYDLRVRWNATGVEPSVELVVVALDDESLARLEGSLGRWPWPRAVFAPVIDYLSEAAVVGLDILFVEGDLQGRDSDLALAEAVAAHGRVVGAAFWDPAMLRLARPFAELAGGLRGIGHTHVWPEADGVVRRHVPVIRPEGEAVYSFSVEVARLYRSELPALALGDGFYLMPGSRLPTMFSLVDVLESWQAERRGEVPVVGREWFSGKIVLIGSLATGLPLDREVTSMKQSEAGVVIAATAVDNLLSNRQYRVGGWWLAAGMTLWVAGLPFFFRGERPWMFLSQAALTLVLFVGVVHVISWGAGWMVPVVMPGLGAALSVTGLLALRWDVDRRQRIHLQRLEEAKQRFTDMLVHDLRNRVSAVQMSLRTLGRLTGDVPGAAREPLQVASASLQQMALEVGSLLDIRKLEEGRMKLTPGEVDLGDLVRELGRDYMAAAEVVEVGMVVEVPGEGPVTVWGDRALLGRLVGNLLHNGLKFSPPGSGIELKVTERSGYGLVSVRNQGRALDDRVRAGMFRPFEEAGGDSDHRGTGLGLTLCRMVAEAHWGRIEVESPWTSSGDGVAVHVYLPLARVLNECDESSEPKVL